MILTRGQKLIENKGPWDQIIKERMTLYPMGKRKYHILLVNPIQRISVHALCKSLSTGWDYFNG